MFTIKRKYINKKKASKKPTLDLNHIKESLQVLEERSSDDAPSLVSLCSIPSAMNSMIMIPRNPMLAKPIRKWSDLKLPGYVEEKYDGERLLLVYINGSTKYFSRNLKELNHYAITPTFNENTTTAILDGELVYYENERIATRATVTNLLTAIKKFHVFDIQYYNNQDVCSWDYVERKRLLKRIIPKEFLYVEETFMDSLEKIQAKYKEVCDRNGEGLILKNGAYKPNTREWIKLKPYYLSGQNNILSLCVDRVLYNRNKIPDRAVCGYIGENGQFTSLVTISSGMIGAVCSYLTLACLSKTRPIVEILFDTVTNKSFRSAKIIRVRPDLEYKDIEDEVMEFVSERLK